MFSPLPGTQLTLVTTVLLLLKIKYTPGYPDELPEISIEVVQGGLPEPTEAEDTDSDEEDEDDYMRISHDDTEKLLQRLQEAGEENLGMAMVYALAMQLKESLTELLIAKQAAREVEHQVEQMKIQDVGDDCDCPDPLRYERPDRIVCPNRPSWLNRKVHQSPLRTSRNGKRHSKRKCATGASGKWKKSSRLYRRKVYYGFRPTHIGCRSV